MKNLILTLALVLGSFMSLGQPYTGTLRINDRQPITGLQLTDDVNGFVCNGSISFDINIDSLKLDIYVGAGVFYTKDTIIDGSNFKIENNKLIVNLPLEFGTAIFSNTNLSISTIEVNDLKLFPNPVNDVLNVDFNSNKSVPVSIMNLNGQVVFETETMFSTQVDMSTLPQGIYMVNVGNVTKKIVKQ